jgi:ribonuclease III
MPAETHVEGGPIGPDEVLQILRERLAEILEIDEGSIALESNFTEDLGADSLALIELVEALEDELGERTVGFRIDDEDLGDLRTVREAVDYVVVRRRRRTPGPIRDLEDALGVRFRDQAILERALAHRSYCAEHPDAVSSNERLEFLGDAVLGLVVTDYMFREYPEMPEGELAKLRASVVNSEVLAEVAREVHLGEALLLGKGEDASGGRAKASILADAMEAVIAAAYLDGGRDSAQALVLHLLEPRIIEGAAGPGGHDYKTRLQELAARRFDQLPRYQVRHEGPDHSRRFFATVLLRGEPWGTGEGRSKKQAEQGAARAAWRRLLELPEGSTSATGTDGVALGGNDAGAT